MLTGKENLQETLKKDGHPDRFVNGYDFLHILVPDTYYMGDYPYMPGMPDGYDQFGVYWTMPEGQMGAFPIHDDEHRVLKDITQWREIVRKPFIPDDPGYWGMLNGIAAECDHENKYVCALYAQGIFERLHALMGMEDTFANFYEEPEEMHALIDFLVDIELDFAKVMIEKCHIEAILHHDDWGAGTNSFLSPDMFEEFIVPAYEKIYGYYKDHGVLVIHHNDGYAANLIDFFPRMHIDIWQGVIPSNDIPAMLDKMDGKVTFMGEIETRVVDVPTWTPELVNAEVERACKKIGPRTNFIPCLTAGMFITAFPGVDQAVREAVDRMSAELFK